ncbi:hypothetical protein H0H92_000275 [Tricholoma furcatifolium]|nr:hypothetical protein H0H92_000275 [Tricholoma furcatifolium]
MVRATTRSQRPSTNTQTQGRHNHSQKTRQEDDDHGAYDEQTELGNGDNQELKRKANDLTLHPSFALVLGQNTRAFNIVFSLAQEILKKAFGMELVELQTRAGLEADGATQEEDRNATGVKKKATVVGSKTYILRSVLDPLIIEHAALTDEKILEQEAADAPSDDDDDDESYTPKYYGSLVSWTSNDQLGALGILYTILALILVSGRVITEAELRVHLKRLGLPQGGLVSFTAQSTHPTQNIDTYLSTLIRQGYLDRIQVGDAKAQKSKGGKRTRMNQPDDDNGATYEWRWGSRAQSEVGEQAIANFVAEFMIGDAEDDDDEGGRGTQGRLERMTKGIERAAGGQLSDAK